MAEAQQLKEDLHYVAATVRRAEQYSPVASICYLWAALVLVGFSLSDWSPQHAGPFWLAAAPLGTLISFVLGWRAGRGTGEVDRALGARYAWHWGLALLGFVGVIFPAIGRAMPLDQEIPYFLLVAALAYGMAGVHLDPPLRNVGLIMFAGYAALTVFQLPYSWTVTGVLVCGALFYAGLRSQR